MCTDTGRWSDVCALEGRFFVGHRMRGVLDQAGLFVHPFPSGCAYRRVLQRWLGRNSLAHVRVLELGSYHAIVACVAAGAGIALLPESVLDTMRQQAIVRHALPKVYRNIVKPLIWRRDVERHPALHALRMLLAKAAVG